MRFRRNHALFRGTIETVFPGKTHILCDVIWRKHNRKNNFSQMRKHKRKIVKNEENVFSGKMPFSSTPGMSDANAYFRRKTMRLFPLSPLRQKKRTEAHPFFSFANHENIPFRDGVSVFNSIPIPTKTTEERLLFLW